MKTVETIIVDAIADGLGLPRTNIQNDVIAQAVLYYNVCGKELWDSYTWKNRYIDQFDMTPSSGIITFSTTEIDVLLALRQNNTNAANNEGAFLWTEDQVNAARNGEDVGSQKFVYLADDASGYRKVKLADTKDASTYRCLALLKFSEAIVSLSDPQDYRTLNWLIDHLDYALTLYIADKLRVWDGNAPNNLWKAQYATALEKVEGQEQKQRNFYPSDPEFGGIGDFIEGTGSDW